ncbi:hypothetical protein [Albidovulum sediminis]|uniref:Uncharacterized protein n=1 Tax=Albidovulum sediminis TaxID=3066345 RepID=A0ABT2NG87_9RHOB|nr:hypothetical protein [Defluviimonas sediminis]MCT8327926.1 hypothetical protein [Defluviimonas sediminis]
MKRFVTTVIAVAVGGAGAYGIVHAASTLTPFSVADASPRTSIDYADFVSIMMTGISLILAALGFVVAILAFIGWNSIGDRVSSLAKTFLQDAIKEGGELHDLVKNEAKSIIYRGVEPVDTEFEEGEKEEGTS